MITQHLKSLMVEFKKAFSPYHLSFTVIMALSLTFSCSGPGATSEITSTGDRSDKSLRITYTGAYEKINQLIDNNTHTIIFSNEESRSNGIEVTLTVAAGASLSNSGGMLTLDGNSYPTKLTFANSNVTHTFTVIAQDGVTIDEYTIKSTVVSPSNKQILSFTLEADNNNGLDNDVSASINEQTKTITLSIINSPVINFIPTINFVGSNISPESGIAQDFNTNVTYTVTAYDGSTANYTVSVANSNEVTFNTNGGTVSNAPNHVVAVSNGGMVTPPTLTQEHYDLEGWYTNKDGDGEKFNFTNTSIIAETTLYAHWTNKLYTVTFNIDGTNHSSTNLPSLSTIPSGAYPIPPRGPSGESLVYTWFTDPSLENLHTHRELTNHLSLFTSAANVSQANIKNIINIGVIPNNIDVYDALSKAIFSNYTAGARVTARYVKPDGSGNKDGTSWQNAAADLRPVITEITDANNNHVYVVLIASGNYKPTTSYNMKNHVAIIGGFTADTDTYSRTGETQLDGNNNKRVFYHDNNGLTNTALLYGLTITNGNANEGGGMLNDHSSPKLIEVTFSGNRASKDGGGMYNSNSSSPILINVIFSGNTAIEGGGMYNWGGSPTLIDVTFSSNKGDYAGGMFNRGSSPTLTDVTFSANTARISGGGMHNNNNSSPVLIRVTFSDNKADNSGGGMFSWGGSSILTDVTFSANKASYGGGMFNSYRSSTLTDVTFSANTAAWGGGMYNQSSSPTLINVTFFDNTATHGGGGMFNQSSSPTLINTLLWGNENGNIYLYNINNIENLNLYYSLIEGGVTTPSTTATGIRLENSNTTAYRINIQSTSIINANPNLQALADNEGGVLTHAIPSGSPSPAKDAGVYVQGVKTGNSYSADKLYYSTSSTSTQWYRASDNQLVDLPKGSDDLTTTDARGYGRVGRPDIGAYEVDGIAPNAP